MEKALYIIYINCPINRNTYNPNTLYYFNEW